MNFEEALEKELKAIPELENKIFPVVAPDYVLAPYLVYKKESLKFVKTLSGVIPNKAEGIYKLAILSDDYPELQTISFGVRNALFGFLQRKIGDEETGPFVENVSVEFLGDGYVLSEDLYRSDMQCTVKYKEG